jgi:pimeloyl-ACP methyl ester carboxylesterase
MKRYGFLDLDRVLVIGMSNGGGFAPLVLRRHPVRGFIAAGSWGRTWYEHMLENERVRLTSEGKSAAEVNDATKVFTQFYDLYLIQGQTPGEILRQHPQWKLLWYDSTDGQYGRPAAFYQQLQALNLGELWQNVDQPVLVIRGSRDTVMSRADASAVSGSALPQPARNRNRLAPCLNGFRRIFIYRRSVVGYRSAGGGLPWPSVSL